MARVLLFLRKQKWLLFLIGLGLVFLLWGGSQEHTYFVPNWRTDRTNHDLHQQFRHDQHGDTKFIKDAAEDSFHWSNGQQLQSHSPGGVVVLDSPADLPVVSYSQDMSPAEKETALFSLITRYGAKCPTSVRAGRDQDCGYEVCWEEPYRLKQPCLVYSFGIRDDWSFDDDMAEKYGCFVRAFDPNNDLQDHQRAGYRMFYATGLGGKNEVNARNWRMRTLGSLMVEFGESESIIDYLKFDIEGGEWDSLEAMFREQVLHRVRQVGMEIHMNKKIKPARMDLFFRLLSRFEEFGFRRWYYHEFALCQYASDYTNKMLSGCFEMVYININFLDRDYSPVPISVTGVEGPKQLTSGRPNVRLPLPSELYVLLDRVTLPRERQNMGQGDLGALYQGYAESRGITCPKQIRVGGRRHNWLEDGWDICLGAGYNLQPPCIVYSVSIGEPVDFRFEDEVANRFRCKLHSIVESNQTSVYDRSDVIATHLFKRPLQESFMNVLDAVGNENNIVELLKLRAGSQVDFWDFLGVLLERNLLSNVKQLMVEIGTRQGAEKSGSLGTRVDLLNELEKQGFVHWTSFHRAVPVSSAAEHRNYRISYLNTNFIRE